VVAIAGPPNVGKSTLMNALARREVAIVSPHAGTTRDVIEVQLDLDGYPVTGASTPPAFARPDDPVEQEGVRRARPGRGSDLCSGSRRRTQEKSSSGSAPVWLGAQQDRSDAADRRAGTGTGQVFGISASRGDG
jgi:tRNA modification GTPase